MTYKAILWHQVTLSVWKEIFFFLSRISWLVHSASCNWSYVNVLTACSFSLHTRFQAWCLKFFYLNNATVSTKRGKSTCNLHFVRMDLNIYVFKTPWDMKFYCFFCFAQTVAYSLDVFWLLLMVKVSPSKVLNLQNVTGSVAKGCGYMI